MIIFGHSGQTGSRLPIFMDADTQQPACGLVTGRVSVRADLDVVAGAPASARELVSMHWFAHLSRTPVIAERRRTGPRPVRW